MVQRFFELDHAFAGPAQNVVSVKKTVVRRHDQDVLVEPERADLLGEIVDFPDQLSACVIDVQLLAAVTVLRALIVAGEHSVRLPAYAVSHPRDLRVNGCHCAASEIRQIQRVVKIENALRAVLREHTP